MSRGSRKGRGLSKEENELWQGVTRAVTPLRKRANPAPDDLSGTVMASSPAKPRKTAAAAFPPDQPRPKSPPPLAPLDRKTKQRIARGRREIGARLDLHGHTQAQAHDALLRFLRMAQAKSASVVLVITGKGVRGDGERGVLRRTVPLWLGMPEFRDYVVGFDDASAGHGGEGALYVRVRKKRV